MKTNKYRVVIYVDQESHKYAYKSHKTHVKHHEGMHEGKVVLDMIVIQWSI